MHWTTQGLIRSRDESGTGGNHLGRCRKHASPGLAPSCVFEFAATATMSVLGFMLSSRALSCSSVLEVWALLMKLKATFSFTAVHSADGLPWCSSCEPHEPAGFQRRRARPQQSFASRRARRNRLHTQNQSNLSATQNPGITVRPFPRHPQNTSSLLASVRQLVRRSCLFSSGFPTVLRMTFDIMQTLKSLATTRRFSAVTQQQWRAYVWRMWR